MCFSYFENSTSCAEKEDIILFDLLIFFSVNSYGFVISFDPLVCSLYKLAEHLRFEQA